MFKYCYTGYIELLYDKNNHKISDIWIDEKSSNQYDPKAVHFDFDIKNSDNAQKYVRLNRIENYQKCKIYFSTTQEFFLKKNMYLDLYEDDYNFSVDYIERVEENV